MDKTTLIICRHGLYLPTSNGLKKLSSLDELKQQLNTKKVEVLVGPNLSYLENISLPANKSNQDKEIEKYLKAALPDDVIADSWTVETISKTDANHLLRVFAIETDFFGEFTSVLLERKIKVNNYSSLALSTANLISDTKPHLIIFVQSDVYFLVAQIGEKIFVNQVEHLQDLKSEIAEFLITLEENNNAKIEALYSYSDRDLSSLELAISDIPVNFGKLKPYFSIPSKVVTKPVGKKPNLIWIVVGLALLTMVAGLIWSLTMGKNAADNTTPSPSPSPVAIEPSPQPIDLTTVEVEVFNGTTTSGYAGKIANLLKEAGYTQVETGNNKQSKYTKNTLLVSDIALSDNFIKLLPEFNLEVVSEEITNPNATKSAKVYLVIPSND